MTGLLLSIALWSAISGSVICFVQAFGYWRTRGERRARAEFEVVQTWEVR